MKTMLIYDKLVPVNREQHRSLKIKPSATNLSFARDLNSMLLATTELPLAALDFPCVFVGEGDQRTLVAIVGLRDKENLFLDDAGRWEQGAYVPAFVRRYPFVLAQPDAQSQELTLCLDEAFDGFNSAEGEALFQADGQDSDYLKRLQQFLLDFHNDMGRTAAFARQLVALDLLVERNIDFQLGEQRMNLQGIQVVDENKLRALPADKVQELFASGALGFIHAHLLSLNNVNKLGARLMRKLAN
jgi:SapC